VPFSGSDFLLSNEESECKKIFRKRKEEGSEEKNKKSK